MILAHERKRKKLWPLLIKGRSLKIHKELKPQSSSDKIYTKMQLFLFGFSPVQMEAICHASNHEHTWSVTHPHQCQEQTHKNTTHV